MPRRLHRMWISIGAMSSALLVAGCGQQVAVPSPTVTVTQTVVGVLAKERLPVSGGSVSANGVRLTVPPGVLSAPTEASISSMSDGAFDLHLAGEWSGAVEATLPLGEESDVVVHQVGGDWGIVSDDLGQATVETTSLSPFSTLKQKFNAMLCLKKLKPNAIAACLALKGVKFVSKKLFGQLIGTWADDPCYKQMLESAGPMVLLSAFTGDCVVKAGGDFAPGWTPPVAQPPAAQPPAPVDTAPPPVATTVGSATTAPVAATPVGNLRVAVSWGAVNMADLQGYIVSAYPQDSSQSAAGHPSFSTATQSVEDFGSWSPYFGIRAGQVWKICVEGYGPVDPSTGSFTTDSSTFACSDYFVLQ